MFDVLHPPRTMYEVWELLPEGTLCQLVNNNLVMSPSPVNAHQVVLNKINFQILCFLEVSKVGELRIAPFDVYFNKRNIFQPDIIFITNENLNKVESKGLVGVPDLVIEILSPGTAHIDMGEKRDIYEQYGVKEYFIVDPATKTVTSFVLQGKEFNEMETTIGIINSKLLNTLISF
jgi:Uma2 family endonuclease